MSDVRSDDEEAIEERACLMEFDGGLSRAESMRLAREMHNRQRVIDHVARIRQKLRSAGVETT